MPPSSRRRSPRSSPRRSASVARGRPQPPAAAPPSPGAEQARANIQATQVGPIDEEAEAQESPDDIDLDDDGAGADELLAKHLGAELIGEEEPEL